VELRVEADAAAVAAWVADQLLEHCRRRAAAPAAASPPLGLATGRTMEPVYAALAQRWWQLPEQQRHGLQRSWCSYNLDDYVGLPAGDPRSFRAFMQQRLVEPLGLDPQAVRLPDGTAADPAVEAGRYGAELEAAGGVGLQLLGLGLNGHVGFNEPPCGPEARCRCLALSPETRAQNAGGFGGDPGAVPSRAITLGLAEILAAETILLVVTGAAKAPVLRRLLQEPPSPALPASWLQRHPAITVIADRAAAP
jgi:glucosamine-6-phosphate deaminase